MANNVLHKDINRTYIAGSPGIPATSGRPFRPARWVTRTRTECSYGVDESWYIQNGWTRQALTDGFGNPTGQFAWLPPSGSGGSGWTIPYTYSCRTVSYQVFVPSQSYIAPTPGVAPTPAQVQIDYNIGWTGRARSRASFPNFGEVEFEIPLNASGAVVGLNTEPKPTGYRDIKFAIYGTHGVARIMESGVEIENLGSYTSGTRFKIRRYKGFITYYKDNTLVRSTPNEPEPLFLDAALYTGGDTVENPSIIGISDAEGFLQPLAGLGSGFQYTPAEVPELDDTTPASLQPLIGSGTGTQPLGGDSNGSLEPLVVFSRANTSAVTQLSALTGLGADRPYGSAVVTMAALTGQGEAGSLAPSYAVSSGVIGIITGQGEMLTGELISSAGVIAPLVGLSSEGTYGTSTGSLRPLQGSGNMLLEAELVEIGMISTSFGDLDISIEATLFVVMNSEGGIEEVFAAEAIYTSELISEGGASEEFVMSLLANVVMESVAGGFSLPSNSSVTAPSGEVPQDFDQTETWVANAENQGYTRYSNYGFNSFTKIGNEYYGCKPDGLYKLDSGEDDEGDPIRAMVSLGNRNFNTQAFKKVHNCYVGMSSAGRMFLKVILGEEEYIFRSRRFDSTMGVQRIDLARGLRATFYEFELYNEDGEDFELDSIEFVVANLNRRI